MKAEREQHVELRDLAARFWAFKREEMPIVAITAGQPFEGDLLLREAPSDHERRASWAEAALEELNTIDKGSLNTDEQTVHALLHHELVLLVEFVQTNAYLRPPLYPLGPEFVLQSWAGATTLTTVEQSRQYLARLRKIPEAIDGIRKTLTLGKARGYRYPNLVICRATKQIRASLSVPASAHPFTAPLQRIAPRSGELAELADQGSALVNDVLYPAFHSYADFVEHEMGAQGRNTLSCRADKDGEAYYRYLIKASTTLDLVPNEIHALGLREVHRIEKEMAGLANGDLAFFQRRLRDDCQQFAQSGEELREQVQALAKRIDAKIPEYFGRLPRITYGVQSIPKAISESLPPAYAQPNPADRSAAGVFWITSIAEKCPRYIHIPLVLHEAWPGHLMHLALVQEMEHLPDFQKYGALRYSSCLEGWALYCEQLGNEMGLYDSADKRYGLLEMEMWRAVRLVVDTGIHALEWSRETAIAYFEKHLAMPRSTVETEVDRYIGWPGQALAYQLGSLRFRAIRDRAEMLLGDHFDVRRFHDALLAAGPVTLPVLDQLMDAWMSAERQSNAA